MKPKVYQGKIQEGKNYLNGLVVLYLDMGKEAARIESLFEEFVDDGKTYRITIEDIEQVKIRWPEVQHMMAAPI